MLKSHYEVLGLIGSISSFGTGDIKTAYKRALLLHHPDKKHAKETKDVSKGAAHSIDEIANAYKALLDPKTRAEHDRELTLQEARQKLGEAAGHTGLETVDLDDLDMVDGRGDDEGDAWSKSCRCGRRYAVTESQLEQEADKGELYIPCEGCSLWLKVLFQATDDT